MPARISNATRSAASAVMPAWSNGGQTSRTYEEDDAGRELAVPYVIYGGRATARIVVPRRGGRAP